MALAALLWLAQASIETIQSSVTCAARLRKVRYFTRHNAMLTVEGITLGGKFTYSGRYRISQLALWLCRPIGGFRHQRARALELHELLVAGLYGSRGLLGVCSLGLTQHM